ncbi:hypothetical protein TNCT_467381 [Trichonephila clavata]|uniref:Uncharacterized protein n=1 Tax=Trichonephila clavata TaxID=2740835 RepID=A0A8X6GWY9_TRICU|nr:hypothetical protein TNCT_467381 [Trichonephila clavata]
MTSIIETESSKNEYDCLKCGEGFQDFTGVIFHDCPKKETKRRRLLTMFEIFETLQVKKCSVAEQVGNVAENGSPCITSKRLSPSCKISKEDYSWSLSKQKELKLSASERYLKIQHRKRCIKPQSCARHKTSLSAKLSDDVIPGYCMEHFTKESDKYNHNFNIDLHEEHSKEGTKKDFAELLSGFNPEIFFEFHKASKNYFSNDFMNLEAVNVSEIPSSSNAVDEYDASNEDPKRDFIK